MTNSPVTESVVEQAALAWLERTGFLIRQAPEIAPFKLFCKLENSSAIAPEISLYKTRTTSPTCGKLGFLYMMYKLRGRH